MLRMHARFVPATGHDGSSDFSDSRQQRLHERLERLLPKKKKKKKAKKKAKKHGAQTAGQ